MDDIVPIKTINFLLKDFILKKVENATANKANKMEVREAAVNIQIRLDSKDKMMIILLILPSNFS